MELLQGFLAGLGMGAARSTGTTLAQGKEEQASALSVPVKHGLLALIGVSPGPQLDT